MTVATITGGKICIPQAILDLIGLKPGDIVTLASSPEGIVVTKISHLKPVEPLTPAVHPEAETDPLPDHGIHSGQA